MWLLVIICFQEVDLKQLKVVNIILSVTVERFVLSIIDLVCHDLFLVFIFNLLLGLVVVVMGCKTSILILVIVHLDLIRLDLLLLELLNVIKVSLILINHLIQHITLA